MGVFGDIFDFFTGTSGTTQQQDLTTRKAEDVEQTSLKTTGALSTEQTGRVGVSQQTINLLPQENIDLISRLVANLSASGGLLPSGVDNRARPGAGPVPATVPTGLGVAGEATDVARFITERAVGGGGIDEEVIQQIISAAQLEGEQAIGRETTRLAGTAGSGLNTVVQKAAQESIADLTTKLAGLEGELRFKGSELLSQDLASAFAALDKAAQTGQAISSDVVKSISDLLEIQKGATGNITLETEEQETVNQLQQLLEAIQQLTEGTTIGTSAGTSEGTQGSSIIDFLKIPFLTQISGT